MEVLTQFGTDEQKDRWLRPLLDGEIRSAFAMTEPDVASSDATQHRAAHRARRRRVRPQRPQVVDVRRACARSCKIFIVMGKTDPEAPAAPPAVDDPRAARHAGRDDRAQPAGVRLRRPGGPCRGHASRTSACRRPTCIAGEGDGFLIAQARLGPGRIHHCMRAIGAAERALELMCRRAPRARRRSAQPVADARQRPGLDRRVADRDRDDPPAHDEGRLADGHRRQQARAHGDRGDQGRRAEHGAEGHRPRDPGARRRRRLATTSRSPRMYAHMRTLRLADGPDEVHKMTIARHELRAATAPAEEPARAASRP